jgi:hypothetical protein
VLVFYGADGKRAFCVRSVSEIWGSHGFVSTFSDGDVTIEELPGRKGRWHRSSWKGNVTLKEQGVEWSGVE